MLADMRRGLYSISTQACRACLLLKKGAKGMNLSKHLRRHSQIVLLNFMASTRPLTFYGEVFCMQDWKTPPARDDGYDRDLPPDPPVFQAACDTLAGLATDPSVRQQVLAMLAPLLTQTTMVPQACQAMLVVAGSDAKAHEHLVQPALDPLLHLMKTAPPDMLTQPT
eukprot:scaffold280551_cov14-Tisochrysis_lutea.AAC.1